MRRFLLPAFLFVILNIVPSQTGFSATPSPGFDRVPLHFEVNQGQAAGSVQYLSKGDGYTVCLGPAGATLSLHTGSGRCATVTMSLAGSDFEGSPIAQELQTGRINYFIGDDPSRWRANMPTFGKVTYKSTYPGVDLVYYGQGRKLEYDFVVAPGADTGCIGLTLAGTTGLRLMPDGALAVDLEGREMRWQRPVAYQKMGTSRQVVECRYKLTGNTVRFELGEYDRSRALVIDPVLLYSTYLGGASTSGDDARAVVVDSAGNAYFTGYVNSGNFPDTTGPIQGGSDAYVTKLDPTGTNVIFSTFFGGSANDEGRAIAVDGNGNILVAGQTSSLNFPNTNGFQPSHASDSGSRNDAFLTEFGPSGTNMLYSTYIGGNDGTYESAYAVGVDATGKAYVAGTTDSANFPLTPGALRTNPPTFGGTYSSFITSIDPSKSGSNSLVYSTYFGGSGLDGIAAMTVNGAGNAYVTGWATSPNFPTTAGAFQTKLSGDSDAFVAELNPTGTGLVFSTLLGGSGNENLNTFCGGIALDPDGNVYITGTTGSTDFPITAGAAQPTFGGGNVQYGNSGDAFITKFNPAGTALIFSTYYGGSQDEISYGIALDTNRNVYITGQTSSVDLPTRQPLYPNNRFDAFATTNGGTNWTGFAIGATVVNVFAFDPLNSSNVYGGALRTGDNPMLYKSTDAGASWAAAQYGLPTNVAEINVMSLAVDPSQPGVIYAGLDSSYGIFKSVNGGVNWMAATNGLCSGETIYCLAVDPNDSANVFAGTTCGLYRSTNAGALWTVTSVSGQIYTIAADPLDAGVIYAGGNTGIYKSFDHGNTFGTGVSLPSFVYSIAINPSAPTNIFVGTSGSGIYQSVDGGTNFVATSFSIGEIQRLVIDPNDPSVLYASEALRGYQYGVLQSVDDGTNWNSANTGIPGYYGSQDINFLAVDPSRSGFVFAATSTGAVNAFVAKLDSTGSIFVYSDYLGGTKGTSEGGFGNPNPNDIAQGIGVDRKGNAVVVGQTYSADFPLTNALQPYYDNNQSAFIARIGSASNADMAVSAVVNTNQALVNGTLVYTFTVKNNGPDDATAVTLVDVLPSAESLQSAALSQGSYELSGQSVNCNLGAIANGASATATLTIVPILTGTVQNTATVTANENDTVLSNNTSSATATVLVNSALHTDLALTVTATPNPALVGYDATYTFNVTNNGPDPASGVVLTNLLPYGVGVSSLSSSQGIPVQLGQAVSCIFGNLPVGAGASLIVVVTPLARGTLTDLAGVNGNESDPHPANNVVSTQIQAVSASAQVVQNGPITLQSNLNFTLTVTNTGPDPIYNLSVLDYLPSDAVFQSANSSQGSCSFSSGVIECSLGTLGLNSTATISINAIGPSSAGIYTNAYQVYSGPVLLLEKTNMTTASIFVTTVDLTNSIVAGQIETSITTVSNAGPDTAVNLLVERLFGGSPYFSSSSMSVPGTTTNFLSANYRYVDWTITLAPGAVATLTASAIPYLGLYPLYYENYTQTLESMINNGNDTDFNLGDVVYVHAGPGLLSFSQPSYVSAPNATVASASVARAGGAVGTISVSYFTSDGTATAGIDYQPVSGVLTFQPGQTEANIDVSLFTNVPYTENKTVNLYLANPQDGATFGQPTTATLTIVKNHVPVLAPVKLLSKAWTNFPGVPGNLNAHLDPPSMTPDGRWVAFSSAAYDLAEQVTNEDTFTNVFVTDMVSGAVTLASVNELGVGCGDSNSFDAQITPDGRYVAFQSYSSDLVSNDFNNNLDVFVRDLMLGQTKLVSIRADGTGSSFGYATLDAISTNGQFVLFESSATDLVSQAVNGFGDVYLRDLVNNKTILASTGANGPGSGATRGAAMTPDGRFVVFASESTNLAPGTVVTNLAYNIYVRDTVANATRIVSSVDGQGGSEESFFPLITPDGRYVVFNSYATNLAPNITNNQENVFISDLSSSAISAVDASGTGALANSYGQAAAVSTNGQFVLFYSMANNLAPGAALSSQGVFLRDTVSNNTFLVSVGPTGVAAPNSTSSGAVMTPDGRFVAFASTAPATTNLDYAVPDVFVRDMLSNTTLLVNISTNASGYSGNQSASSPSITPDGRYVSFVSAAATLVAGPVTYYRNVYRRDLAEAATEIVSAAYSESGINPQTGFNASAENDSPTIDEAGRFAAFDSYAANLVREDTNTVEHVYLANLTNGALTLVSASAAGVQGNAASTLPVLSADGSTLIFQSTANNLVPGANNGQQNIYAYNVVTGAISLVSVNTNGAGGDAQSGASLSGYGYSVSANGRYVAFLSQATDLVTNVFTNTYTPHVFLRDLQAATTELLDINTSGRTGDNEAYNPVISTDGSTVTFTSASDFLVPGVTNSTGGFQNVEIYQRNLAAGTTVLVSATPSGGAATNLGPFSTGLYYAKPVVSTNGQFVSWAAICPGLIPNCSSTNGQIFVRNMMTGVTTCVSVNTNGVSGPGDSADFAGVAPSMTPDGRYIAFGSADPGLAPNAANGSDEVYVRDTVAQTTTLISRNAAGTGAANGNCMAPAISADGHYITFEGMATDLVPGSVLSSIMNLYRRDLTQDATILLSPAMGGLTAGDNTVSSFAVSSDGLVSVFSSMADNLVAGDFNVASDVFAAILPQESATADLGLTLTTPASVSVGANVTNSIAITNAGPTGASGVVIAFPVPTGSQYVSARSTVGVISVSNGVVFCNISGLASEATATLSIILAAPSAGQLYAVASVAATQPDSNPYNNSAANLILVDKTVNNSPLLSARISGGVQRQLDLSWPDSATGFILQSATNLSPPVEWTAVTNTVIDDNGNFNLELTNFPGMSQFFRLKE